MRSLREAFVMFQETDSGVGLSGAVQAFVPREQMERTWRPERTVTAQPYLT
ncbi:MAG: hypothetical protein ACXVKQ_20350 [Acidimicrobiia bacterium]